MGIDCLEMYCITVVSVTSHIYVSLPIRSEATVIIVGP
jgi:hypothetical protein